MRRGDDRAVTVQIGAVLLLAILFSALALYQINVVPEQNAEVEFNHNHEVHNEMQELRNGILNTGTGAESHSSSVTLGTQYPTRTVAVNPPNPQGTLETTGEDNIEIDASVTGDYVVDDGDNDEVPIDVESEIFDDGITTTGLVYEPDYNEYRNAPTTRIEHGFAFNDFGGNSVDLTSQPVVDGTDLTIIQVDGDLSETSSSAVSMDVRLKSGPTDPITIVPDNDDEEIKIPTQTPDAWNNNIDESNVTIDEDSDAEGTVSIELEADEEYELRIACVVVGDGTGDGCGDFDITEETSDSQMEGDASRLSGPEVTALTINPDTITKGEEESVEVNAMFNNTEFTQTGNTEGERGGVPIIDTNWTITEENGEVVDEGVLQLEEPDYQPEDLVDLKLIQNGTDNINVGDLESGDYELEVKSMDARGVWTSEDESKTAPLTIEESDENGEEQNAPTINQFDVTDETEQRGNSPNFDVEYQVEWTVSDPDGNLDQVDIRLYDQDGITVDSEVISEPNSDSETGITSLEDDCSTNEEHVPATKSRLKRPTQPA